MSDVNSDLKLDTSTEEPVLPRFNFFRFKQIGSGEYLLTNDVGDHAFLSEDDFTVLRGSPADLSPGVRNTLIEKGFIFEPAREDEFAACYHRKNAFLEHGPSLHIIVLTLRCDHKCVYCQASRKAVDAQGYDMDKKTVEKTVDFVLQSTADSLCIEFQGGEPLLNFDVLKHAVTYTRSKATPKHVIFSIVTNMSFMDEEKMRFLVEEDVSICTSLDGSGDVHNASRILPRGDSYANTVNWVRRVSAANSERDRQRKRFNKVNALITVTKDVLAEPKRTVDLYVELGLPCIHLRPLNPFGYGKGWATRTGYTPDEFLAFYTKALDYILDLNKAGRSFYEKTAQILLEKIIRKRDPNFLDLRSPCGAGIGQLAYNYDGTIFPCDEARMVHASGDALFLLGNVNTSTYSEVMQSETVRTLCVASCLEGLPGCHDCVYNPYCGVCPVYNYVTQGNIFGMMPTNDRCRIYMGIQDAVFSRLREHYDVFSSWVEAD